jgi:hypothetical protein
MTIPAWPADLPQWMTAPDFRVTFPDPRLKTAMESGPNKLRRRVSNTSKPVSGVLRCTQAQLARLERFWNEDTRSGTLPFMFPDQVYDGAFLLTESGEPLLTESDVQILVAGWWLVQFDGPPASTPRQRSTVFTVTVSLNVLP